VLSYVSCLLRWFLSDNGTHKNILTSTTITKTAMKPGVMLEFLSLWVKRLSDPEDDSVATPF
jgi:hypothetical protein